MLFEFLLERVCRCRVVSGELREIRERAERNGAEAALIQLGFHREQRAAFDPAVADAEILREALRRRMSISEIDRPSTGCPIWFGEIDVAALRDVIVHRDDVERSRVGGRVGVRKSLEPTDEICALGNFVGDFSVFALKFADELDGVCVVGEIADGIEGEAESTWSRGRRTRRIRDAALSPDVR